MKIYVDELPKDIAQRRRCFDGYVLNCVELMFDSSYEPKQIALLSDYTKQVRKEVCEEIRKEFFRNCIGAGETEEEQIYYITRTGLKKLLGE